MVASPAATRFWNRPYLPGSRGCDKIEAENRARWVFVESSQEGMELLA